MKRFLIVAAALGTLSVAACHDTTATAPASQFAVTMASAFSTTPAGYGNLSSSYADAGTDAFMPTFDQGGPMGMGMPGGRGFGPDGRGPDGFDGFGPGPGFGLGLMGGGLGGPFLGAVLFPRPHPDSACTYDATSGVTTCSETTHEGLSVTRTFALLNTAGQPQQRVDSTTNAVTTTTAVSGTVTRRDSSTSKISESSTQKVTGLARGSAQLTIDGASAGTENTSGTSPKGAFTATRVTGDTITGLVIPTTSTDAPRYPTAGTVIRAMMATVTITGESPAVSSRREVVTYDGSSTAKVVITHDDSTQTCTQPLPHGHLVCQ